MSDIHEIAKSLRLVGLTEVDDAATLLEEQAARIVELSLDLERARNERNAAHVKARREIHAEYRDRIAALEARAGEAVGYVSAGWVEHRKGTATVYPEPHTRLATTPVFTNPPTGEDSVDAARAVVDSYVVRINSYDFKIQRVSQRSGRDLWKVMKGSECLNKDGEWEYEPMPSSRDDAFIARCRFESAAAAIASLTKTADGEKQS
jgi:hypothetical protein